MLSFGTFNHREACDVPTPRLTDDECLYAYDLWIKYNSYTEAGVAAGKSEAWIRRRVTAARARGLMTLAETPLYAPPPEPPKLRIAVSHLKSEPGWSGDVLAIGDMHDSPKLNKKRFLWCGRAAGEMSVDRIVQIGDIMSVDSLCRMDANDSLKGKDKPSFEADIQSGHEALSAFDRGLNGFKVDKHLTLGNHEERSLSFTNRTPEVAGLLTGMVDNLFMSHGWTYSPYGLVHFIGSVGFVHAPLNIMGKPYGGKTALQRVANDVVHDLVYGHTHKGGETHCSKIGTNQKVTVVDLGCALPQGHIEHYVGHATSGWRYGVNLIKIRDGRIASVSFTTMTEMEERFGD
jgi:hypothetical protein